MLFDTYLIYLTYLIKAHVAPSARYIPLTYYVVSLESMLKDYKVIIPYNRLKIFITTLISI